MDIKNKFVLITGATAGIGLSSAKLLASRGANLIITGRRQELLRDISKNIQNTYNNIVLPYAFDIRNYREVNNFIDHINSFKLADEKSIKISVLINNAGLAKGISPIEEGNTEDWDMMIDTNIKGLLYITKRVIPLMKKEGYGHIINLGSIAGYQVYPGGNVYNATKFAVRALTDAMNIELINSKIKVSSIEPGAVETEFSIVRFNGNKDKADNVYKGFTPLTADNIADIIYYMISLPEHVNIQHLLVTPTAQRSINFINKSNLI